MTRQVFSRKGKGMFRAMSFWDSEKMLAELEKGTERIIVKHVTKGRRAYIDIRTFWRDESEEWKPSKKGIAVPMEHAREVAEAILRGLE